MTHLVHNAGRFLKYMPKVQFRRQELRLVEAAWDNLSLLSSLSHLSSDASSGSDLSRARQDFSALTDEMMRGLESEGLKNALENLGSKAQVCIDIMVRNLFERTADIGFFATDPIIAEYLSQTDPSMRVGMETRLREYAGKYSVYNGIYLFNAQGRLRASLAPRPDLEQIQHPSDLLFLRAVKSSSSPYIEHYAPHHFCTVGDSPCAPTLLYAHRVEANSRTVGVLCLQFDLAHEMPTIFNAVHGTASTGDGVVLAVVSAEGFVIGTSDAMQLPINWRIPQACQAGSSTVRHLGREYLLVVRDTNGFQGYNGPGWRSLAMMPMDMAFDDEDGLEGSALMVQAARSTDLLADELRNIPRHSAAIQASLERSVWNGLLDISRLESQHATVQAHDVTFARILLSEIGNTAHKTAQAFSNSLQDLHSVVMRSVLRDAQGRASLAMQILDRNLYERANDCRWWALTPQFVETLRSGTLACPQATQVLTYINSLYTVYTTLFLFDREGRVIAVSNPDQAHHVGRILQEDWVAQTLKLNTQDDYAVSPFTSNPFSGESSTFVYAAAVRDTEYKNTPVIGGIGIVWDGASQLASILTDCASQASSENLLAFVDANGHLVASLGNAQLLPDPQAVAYCQRDGRIVELAGALYSVGIHSGYGYREFRLRDGYAHGLSCIVLKNLCQSQSCATVTRAHRSGGQTHQVEAGHGLQMASFVVDGHWLGLPAAQVVLAAEDAEIISTSRAHPPFAGMTMIGGKVYPVIDMRSVIKRSAHAAINRFTLSSESESARQMIVVRVSTTADSTHDLVLRVDTLGEVLEVDTRKIQDMNMIKAESSYGLIDAVMPVPGSKDHQANDHALLCRLSNLWLQQSVEAALQDLIPADLACFKHSALTH